MSQNAKTVKPRRLQSLLGSVREAGFHVLLFGAGCGFVACCALDSLWTRITKGHWGPPPVK